MPSLLVFLFQTDGTQIFEPSIPVPSSWQETTEFSEGCIHISERRKWKFTKVNAQKRRGRVHLLLFTGRTKHLKNLENFCLCRQLNDISSGLCHSLFLLLICKCSLRWKLLIFISQAPHIYFHSISLIFIFYGKLCHTEILRLTVPVCGKSQWYLLCWND